MSTISLPKADVPIGTVGGAAVLISPQWMRAFFDMLQRVGGPSGNDASTLVDALPTSERLLVAAQAFLPRAPSPFNRSDEAAQVLAGQIFGA